MAIQIPCPQCAKVLKLGDHIVGKHVRCPMCSRAFLVKGEDASTGTKRDERVRAVPPPLPRRAAPAHEEAVMSGAGAKQQRGPDALRPPALPEPEEEELPEVDVQEVVDEDEDAAPKKKKKKKKKKKYDRRILEDRAQEQRHETPGWVWWGLGGGGVALTEFILLALAVFCPPDNELKRYAAYMFIMCPISTIIFFVAMYLSSIWFEAIEIGELHVAFVKAFILVFMVNAVNLIPLGYFITLPVWLVGLFMLFRCDLWEARVLIFMNYALNFLVNMLLFAAFMAWMGAGGGDFDDDDAFMNQRPNNVRPRGNFQPQGNLKFKGNNRPQGPKVWDLDDVEDLAGDLELDPNDPDDDIVTGISFRNKAVKDEHLAHMKDFPRLVKLDLTNAPITDAGLAHLRACPNLQSLTLTGTRVTEAGVTELRKALPKVQITR